jgi:peptidoglycan/LPS O-acetylase OafA/YrhL
VRQFGYNRAFDGLRGLAVLIVVGFHAALVPGGGFLGVEFFFVLSGFLITTLLTDEWDGNGTISLRNFYRRRALRLLPALVVALMGYVAVSAIRFLVVEQDFRSFADSIAAAGIGASYVANIVIAFLGSFPPGVQHLWSLAAEEQYYLAWPPLLLLALRRRVSTRYLVGALGVVGVAICANRAALTLAGASQRHLFFSPDVTFGGIVIGAILALLNRSGTLPRLYARRFVRAAVVPFTVAFACVFIVLVPNTDGRWLYLYGISAFLIAAGAVVAGAAIDPGAWWARPLRSQPLVNVGRVSYGIYLWHPILMYAAGDWPIERLVAVPATFVIADFSYRFVEQPFLARKRRPREVAAPDGPVQEAAVAGA